MSSSLFAGGRFGRQMTPLFASYLSLSLSLTLSLSLRAKRPRQRLCPQSRFFPSRTLRARSLPDRAGNLRRSASEFLASLLLVHTLVQSCSRSQTGGCSSLLGVTERHVVYDFGQIAVRPAFATFKWTKVLKQKGDEFLCRWFINSGICQ